MTALTGSTLHGAKEDRATWGHIVETAVGAHIYNSMDDTSMNLYYWKTSPKDSQPNSTNQKEHEVDFVLQADDNHLAAFEVKGSRYRRSKKSIQHLDQFRKKFHITPQVIGEGGDISLEEFFTTPVKDWLQKQDKK